MILPIESTDIYGSPVNIINPQITMTLTHPSVNQDAGQFSKLDVGQTVATEGERAPVADYDGARTPRDAGLGQRLYNFLGLYLFSYSQWNSSF